MAIADDIKKTLSDPTPLYALAGASDLAYEKLREVPGRVEALTADRRGTQERAAAALQEAGSRLVAAQAKVTESVGALPTDVKVLQAKAQELAMQQVGRALEFAVKAKEVYDELAVRGRTVVDTAADKGRADETPVAEVEVAEVVVDLTGEDAADESVAQEPVAEDAPAPAKKAGRARKSTAPKE
ncbi:hypothetical protein GCM10010441_73410 [Kitasatospora paracochleata]|uniref:Heparin binding hemagglutinin HbhA n=1 Tax=Kitasatospora paracochleata TaxID=58354 RepID=A0ABT1J6H1_9ACTN|nr:hypothetical protein [Kitasatospora paracochleata]MCP2312734.1 hypothetical protein [Kitasatospora paracochleata]